MPARSRTWTCPRVIGGVRCATKNPRVKQKCTTCGAPRPARKRAAHLVALDESYELYVRLNGGEFCAICLRPRTGSRRLDRDHDHRTGLPRGLLCPKCNQALPSWVTATWLRRAADYLEREAA